MTAVAPPLRVLIADADRDTIDTMAELVRLWGHDTRATYDGVAALKTARAYRPDVALFDLGMPRLDGCGVARRLRLGTASCGTLLLAVTGSPGAAARRRAERSGFDGYLVKPADPELLEQLLRQRRELKEFVREVRRDRRGTAELQGRLDRLSASTRKTGQLLRRAEQPVQ